MHGCSLDAAEVGGGAAMAASWLSLYGSDILPATGTSVPEVGETSVACSRWMRASFVIGCFSMVKVGLALTRASLLSGVLDGKETVFKRTTLTSPSAPG